MSVKMSQIKIAKYDGWFFNEELATDLLKSLKSFTGRTEIKGIDYAKSKLAENLKLIIKKIYRLSNKKNSQAAHEFLYRFYFNRFLFYLTMDAVMISHEQKYDFYTRGVFLHRKPDNKYSIDKLAVKNWFAEELTIPNLLMGYTKSVSSKLISALFDKANKESITKSFNEKMMNSMAQIEDPEMKDLINKIKISRDILIRENNKNPYALTRICKKMSERYGKIPYTTLRDRMLRYKLPLGIKEFTKIYG